MEIESESEALAPYQAHLMNLTKNSIGITHTYLPREYSLFADTLVETASVISSLSTIHLMPLPMKRRDKHAIKVCSVGLNALYYAIV